MKKKIFFYFILIAIPFLCLGILEEALVLLNYGTNYPLVIEEGNYYKLNLNFPKKYFSKQDIITPQLIDQKFPKNKAKNAIRLICLGGSTTAGFPYEENINFPYFMKYRLQWLFPDKKLEVINLGISAINSHAVVDLLPEVLNLNPDAVLIYMGHNEFYGALGLASIESIGSNRTFIKMYLRLKKLRIYQLVRSIVWDLINVFKSELGQKKSRTLMGEIIKQSHILYKSELYKKTIVNFNYNLEDIVVFFKTHNIPVLVSDVVSNIKDQFPFGKNKFLKSGELEQQLQKAKKYKNENKYHLAKQTYEKLLYNDSTNASVMYYYAKCLYHLSEYQRAKKYFQKARDYDVIRFRAPGEINSIIKNICLTNGAVYVESNFVFNSNSKHGIPGKKLFLEHLHPNVKGYFLIASAFVEALKKNDIICKKTEWLEVREKSPERYLKDSGYTSLDIAIGELIIKKLIKEFPFNGNSNFEPTLFENNEILRIAKAHHTNQLYWDEAHYALGNYYEEKRKFKAARREYEAVQKVIPDNFQPYVKLGDLFIKQQNWQKAIDYYFQSLKYNPNSIFTHAKLGKTFIMISEDQKAIDELELVLKLENKKPQLKIEAILELNYLLGLGNARIGKFENALIYLERALSIDSNYPPALNLLRQIRNN